MASRAFQGDGQPLPIALLAQAVPMLTRHELAALTERLIDALDAIDGDPDLEDDDPSGQRDEDGINTGGWTDFDRERQAMLKPIYGVDQSEGPTNFRAAYSEWLRMECGPG